VFLSASSGLLCLVYLVAEVLIRKKCAWYRGSLEGIQRIRDVGGNVWHEYTGMHLPGRGYDWKQYSCFSAAALILNHVLHTDRKHQYISAAKEGYES
jgi:hypothetical protein